MKKIEKRLVQRIFQCYDDLKMVRMCNRTLLTIECFRNRLDELLLLYSHSKDISFIKACKQFGIKYEEVDSPKP